MLPDDYTFISDDAGTHTFTDTGRGETTLVTVGAQTITVTDWIISLDISVTVDPPESGPGGSGHPGPGNGRSSRQPLADLVHGVLKTTENGAPLILATSPVQSPNIPLRILPDLAGDGRAIKKVGNPIFRPVSAASILDRLFAENEDWWKSSGISP
jgi:hypothetical protein